jgi:hypothetical protein
MFVAALQRAGPALDLALNCAAAAVGVSCADDVHGFPAQAFHDKGKDGVRVLMYEEMAKRLQCPLYIHIGHEDGSTSHQPDVYGSDMPGDPIRLIREPTDLYRK